MGALSRKFELVQAMDALLGGVIQDRPPDGALIEGYFISLRGTATAAVPVDDVVDLGQWIMRSNAGASLVSEANFGFLTERTRRMFGSIAWVNNPLAASDPIALHWYHSFDLTGTHGNVYPAAHGDTIEIMLPGVDVAVVEAGTVWEVHRVTVDRGDAFYLPKFHSRALDLAELRYDFAGKTAHIQFQSASVTDPERLSIFDAQGVRLIFSPWVDALAITNIFGRYDQAEAHEVVFQHYSDQRESVIKCFGNDNWNVEMINGAGFIQCSHCVVEPMPEPARALAAQVSTLVRNNQQAKIMRVGGSGAMGAATALTAPSVLPGFASGASVSGSVERVPLAMPKASTAPLDPVTRTLANWKRGN